MEPLRFAVLFSTIVCFLAFGAGFYQEISTSFGKLLCKGGKHRFKSKRYYCSRCKVGRNWPILKCVNGGKIKINFPKI